MTTTFRPGQLVRSRVTAQGLVEGDLYRITSVAVQDTPFGSFVRYYVQAADCATAAARLPAWPVGNGHLVLEAR